MTKLEISKAFIAINTYFKRLAYNMHNHSDWWASRIQFKGIEEKLGRLTILHIPKKEEKKSKKVKRKK